MPSTFIFYQIQIIKKRLYFVFRINIIKVQEARLHKYHNRTDTVVKTAFRGLCKLSIICCPS